MKIICKILLLLILFAPMYACRTVSSSIANSKQTQATADSGQTVTWTWQWNKKHSLQTVPVLFEILYVNAPSLGMRADRTYNAAHGCPRDGDCAAECSMEIYRPAANAGDTLLDRIELLCWFSYKRGSETVTQVVLDGLLDGVRVGYRPKTDGARSFAMQGEFTNSLYASLQKAYYGGRYGRSGPAKPIGETIQGMNRIYQYKNLDVKKVNPLDNTLISCIPAVGKEDATCIFRY